MSFDSATKKAGTLHDPPSRGVRAHRGKSARDPGVRLRTKRYSHAAHPTDVRALERARADGRAVARTPPRLHQGVVPAPIGAVESRSGLRGERGGRRVEPGARNV